MIEITQPSNQNYKVIKALDVKDIRIAKCLDGKMRSLEFVNEMGIVEFVVLLPEKVTIDGE